MAFSFNGNTPSVITFNNNDVLVLKWNGTTVWEKNTIPNHLAFIATSSGTFTFVGSDRTNRISYSIDSGETWSTEANSVSINVQNGDLVLWKGEMYSQGLMFGGGGIGQFGGTASFEAQGNILSLEYGDNFEGQTSFNTNVGGDFEDLFNGSNITSAENLELPCETLNEGCYYQMFYGCSGLTVAPELSSTTLADYCYGSMFRGCSGLTTAPDLLCETLVSNCYDHMFAQCSSLDYIQMIATDITAPYCLYNWVDGVAASGTFVKDKNMTTIPIDSVNGIPQGWTVTDYNKDYSIEYFTVEVLENGTLAYSNGGSYSTDNGTTWSSAPSSISVSAGDKLLFKKNNPNNGQQTNVFNGSTVHFNVYGNIMSLFYEDNFSGQTTLNNLATCKYLFASSNVVDAENLVLPATTFGGYCYQNMFNGCTSLTKAPKILPANNTTTACYEFMFQNCSNLIQAPELPALNADETACYSDIFRNCSKLNYIKAMFTNNPSTRGQNNWVNGVAASGTFVMNVFAPWNPDNYRGVYGVPQNWNVQYETPPQKINEIYYTTSDNNTITINNGNHRLISNINPHGQGRLTQDSSYANVELYQNFLLNQTNLVSIALPSNTTSIGQAAFYGCSNLTSITCYATTAPSLSNNGSFANMSSPNGTLYYPKGSDYSTWLTQLGNGWTGVEI